MKIPGRILVSAAVVVTVATTGVVVYANKSEPTPVVPLASTSIAEEVVVEATPVVEVPQEVVTAPVVQQEVEPEPVPVDKKTQVMAQAEVIASGKGFPVYLQTYCLDMHVMKQGGYDSVGGQAIIDSYLVGKINEQGNNVKIWFEGACKTQFYTTIN